MWGWVSWGETFALTRRREEEGLRFGNPRVYGKSSGTLKDLVLSLRLMKEVEERRVKAIFLWVKGREHKGMGEECVYL